MPQDSERSPRKKQVCFAVLPSLLAAPGVTALQAGLQRLRLLHVLRGLLLTKVSGFRGLYLQALSQRMV